MFNVYTVKLKPFVILTGNTTNRQWHLDHEHKGDYNSTVTSESGEASSSTTSTLKKHSTMDQHIRFANPRHRLPSTKETEIDNALMRFSA